MNVFKETEKAKRKTGNQKKTQDKHNEKNLEGS
jgi:hypothetical protein